MCWRRCTGSPRTALPASATLDGGKPLMWKRGGSITRASTCRACGEPRRGDRLGMPERAELRGKRGAARRGRGLTLWWALLARGIRAGCRRRRGGEGGGGRKGWRAWWRSPGASPRCGSQVRARGPRGEGPAVLPKASEVRWLKLRWGPHAF